MQYDGSGKMVQQDRTFPQKLYKKGGEIVVVNSEAEKQAALSAGASTKVWDKEKHA